MLTFNVEPYPNIKPGIRKCINQDDEIRVREIKRKYDSSISLTNYLSDDTNTYDDVLHALANFRPKDEFEFLEFLLLIGAEKAWYRDILQQVQLIKNRHLYQDLHLTIDGTVNIHMVVDSKPYTEILLFPFNHTMQQIFALRVLTGIIDPPRVDMEVSHIPTLALSKTIAKFLVETEYGSWLCSHLRGKQLTNRLVSLSNIYGSPVAPWLTQTVKIEMVKNAVDIRQLKNYNEYLSKFG